MNVMNLKLFLPAKPLNLYSNGCDRKVGVAKQKDAPVKCK